MLINLVICISCITAIKETSNATNNIINAKI